MTVAALPALAAERPATSFASISEPANVERLAGADRYQTSLEVSRRFPPQVSAVFVATGLDFPDGLAASAAAATLGGPLILTRPGSLPPGVADEIARLQPEHIYVLGGPSVISEAVRTALGRIAPTERLAGVDRYATAERIIDVTFVRAPRILLATGRLFPDALAAGAAAGNIGSPLLLVDGTRATLPSATLAALRRWGVSEVMIAGGHGAVDLRIEQQLRANGYTVARASGISRYETAVAIADTVGLVGTENVLLATGSDFPDALSGAALAGERGAPLLLTRPTCTPWKVHDTILRSGATTRTILGGTGVVSESAAANTACSPAPQREADFATTGWELRSGVPVPYSDRAPVDVRDPSIAIDSSGLRVYLRRDTGQRADHPVAYAQYGISALMEWQRTGERVWLDRAVRHAQRLSEIRTERDGAWWFPYLFPWTYYERTMTVPWWSGMAQGQALSLFVRLHAATADQRWADAAHSTWRSFLQPREDGIPWSTFVEDGLLFFEEYAGNQPPLKVLNGQIFAAFGAYDYWRSTDDPEARRYVDGAATTVLAIMPAVRVPGGISYYCVQRGYCQSPLWQNATYHSIHSWQLDTLARLTGDTQFASWAGLLRSDWVPMARLGTPPEVLGWPDGPPQ
ncbi:cell wall-binding repeat-containing protein [Microbacterium hominis]|uniref:Cell wall-binding repeat-containing protein n=1 Tax=Microbacterium hominis TaxID=162426 RepID=A0A7D4QJQ8_9MICO|nr:cell wall-binding repeat-containing protein [Microbacterium hominis]QKJ20016.1 cell wall-binding repeat-containing protein [Microbacterium hominis]